MSGLVKLLTVVGILAMLAGCYEQIPPTTNGKILTPNGYKIETIPPSRTWVGWREELVLLDKSVKMYKEPMTILMRDKLELSFDVKARVRIGGSDDIINAMFDDITPRVLPNSISSGHKIVPISDVYTTYGRMLVRNVSRSVVSKYSIDDVNTNYENINNEIRLLLMEAFKTIPLTLDDVALGGLAYPDVVTRAVEQAKERQMGIEKEKSQVEIELTKKRGAEQLANADYRIRMIQAKTIRDENKMVSEGVTDKYLAYRRLEVQEKMAEAMRSNGNSTVFMPYEALPTVGSNVRIMSGK